MIQHIYLGCGPTREATSQKTSYNIYIYMVIIIIITFETHE
jgi:hypothetical protein